MRVVILVTLSIALLVGIPAFAGDCAQGALCKEESPRPAVPPMFGMRTDLPPIPPDDLLKHGKEMMRDYLKQRKALDADHLACLDKAATLAALRSCEN